VGSLRRGDGTLVKAAGFRFIGIPAGKWRRYFDLRNLIDLVNGLLGLLSAFFVVLLFWPSKVFIKGGFVGLPVGIAAWVLGRPIILHESDVVMGVANRLLAKLARTVCVSFPIDGYNLPPVIKAKLIYTGVPINEVFFDPTIGKLELSWASNSPIIFIMGGSQGAHVINEIVKTILPTATSEYEIVHLTGELDYEAMQDWAKNHEIKNYHVFSSLPNQQVASLMKQANLIISRAGATALMEIAAIGKPAILIPLPGSASNHQYLNAKYLADKQAAILMEQQDVTPDVLMKQINQIIRAKTGDQLRSNLGSLVKRYAADGIADLLLNFGK
jgi:UDP-N-acetylglucosamine--N-acetylmuramyl-(pentapeptide) pyrophosphoryl-undecaprenol N-acetylglucosamine transferase